MLLHRNPPRYEGIHAYIKCRILVSTVRNYVDYFGVTLCADVGGVAVH